MATLPPWLEATPQLYAGVAEAGLREGVQVGAEREKALEFGQEMALKQQEFQANTALTAQKLQQEQLNTKMTLAKFLSDQKQQDLSNQLAMDKFQHDKNIADQEMALKNETLRQTMDWRNTQAKTQQQRYQMSADVAARKFQAQQEAMTRIHNGEDPAKVLLDLGAALGESASGLASLWKDTLPQQPKPDASEGPPMITRGGKTFYGNYDDKGNLRWTEARGQSAGESGEYLKHLAALIKLQQDAAKLSPPGSPERMKLAQLQAQYEKALEGMAPGGGGGGGGPAGINTAKPYNPPTDHPESGDYVAPGYQDEEGATEAPTPTPAGGAGLMQFPPQPYRLPLGIP